MSTGKLIELNKQRFSLLEDCFDIKKLSLKSIINQMTSGIIYVDALDNPQFALAWDYGHRIFILGDVAGDALIISAKEIIFNRFFNSEKSGADILDFEIYCPSDAARNNIMKIFEHHPVMLNLRRYYTLDISTVCLEENDSEFMKQYGCSVYNIDEALLSQSELTNIEDIRNWIKENWISTEAFLSKGLGKCIVKDKTIASWSLLDYRVKDTCEMGIETDGDFRKQGLGEFLVREVLKACREMRITKVSWDCREDNIASIGLAEKVGFVLQHKYDCYHGWFHPIDNFLINGYYYLYTNEDYSKSRQSYERGFAMSEERPAIAKTSYLLKKESSKKWFYYDMGCCEALLNEGDKAISYIEQAIVLGWTDIDMLKNDERLNSLHTDQRWLDIMNNAK